MKIYMIKIFYFIFFNLFLFFNCFSQDIEKIRAERDLLIKEIENTKDLLKTKINSREEVFKQVSLLNNEIISRENLISNFKSEIDLLDSQIELNQLNINELEVNINLVKAEYVKLLQDSYLRRNSMNELLFFLSASDFSEGYRRYRLLKEYSNYRQQQGKILIENQNKLKSLLQKSQGQRDEKEQSLLKLEEEYVSLNRSQVQKRKLATDLQKEEKWLKQTISNKEKKAQALENQILEYIRLSSASKSILGNDFKDYYGNLIWPVKKGVVVNQFGEHEHPVLKGVLIKNNGVDIQSTGSDEIVAVHLGEISRIISIPGYNNAIIIRHGDYLTVYANLKDIFVKQGQKITTGTLLGKIYKESNESDGVLHFEIWQENQKLDPVKWLKP